LGYKLIASNSAATGVTDNEWEDILALASEQGVSVQQLRLDERNDRTDIAGADAYALYEALGYALPGIAHLETEDEVLDRNTVHRVRHVLRWGSVRLSRTPR
jgi:hypothetical protein